MSDGDKNPASTPTPVTDVQGDGRWMSLHHRFIADSKDKEPEVVFIGDSLVQLLHQFEIWRELFSPLHALNFGMGGDATQHVLWRLQNGELQHIRPKLDLQDLSLRCQKCSTCIPSEGTTSFFMEASVGIRG